MASRKTTGKRPRPRVALRTMQRPASQGRAQSTSKARLILQYAHDSARALIDAFEGVRGLRKVTKGAPTDEEQDLLRAMLVLAAAGLDSMAKQLIRDTLPELIKHDANVRSGLAEFAARELRGEAGAGGSMSAARFLGRILAADSHRDQLIEEYILDLTGASLQSAEELMRTASALGVEPQSIGIDPRQLRPIFGARNKIIHELDINFDNPNRNRESRTRPIMTRYTNTLLEVGESLLNAVEEKL